MAILDIKIGLQVNPVTLWSSVSTEGGIRTLTSISSLRPEHSHKQFPTNARMPLIPGNLPTYRAFQDHISFVIICHKSEVLPLI